MPEEPEAHGQSGYGGLVALAVMKGWLTDAQLNEAEALSRKLASDGVPLTMLEILAKKGFLSSEQIAELERHQRAARGAALIPGFELIAKVGQGAMGAVYRATQKNMNRQVAIKILPPALAKKAGFIERFQREARASARVNHPNVVSGIDVGEASGYHYFVMEFVEGTTLRKKLETHGRMPETEVLSIALKMANALVAVEKAGLVHRDIKPENIMLVINGEAKLCDLGLARLQAGDTNLTQTDAVLGTPLYMSPEQAQGKSDLDIRSDIYSLGATLYHLATGQPLFAGDAAGAILAQHITAEAPHPRALVPEISNGLSSILRRMLAKEPQHRYANAGELVEDFALLFAGKAPRIAQSGGFFKSSVALSAGTKVVGAGSTVGTGTTTLAKPLVGQTTAPNQVVRRSARTGLSAAADTGGDGRKRMPVGILVGAGALVLCMGAWFLLRGGEKEKAQTQEAQPPGISEKSPAIMVQGNPGASKSARSATPAVPKPVASKPESIEPAVPEVRSHLPSPEAPTPSVPPAVATPEPAAEMPIPPPTMEGQTLHFEDFKPPSYRVNPPPVEREGEAFIFKQGMFLQHYKGMDFSCEFELFTEIKMSKDAGFSLTLPRRALVYVRQALGAFVIKKGGSGVNPVKLEPEVWHRLQVRMTAAGLEGKLGESSFSCAVNDLSVYGAQPINIMSAGSPGSRIAFRNFRLVLGKALPPPPAQGENRVGQQPQPPASSAQPAAATTANPADQVGVGERAAQPSVAQAGKWEFQFTREEDLKDWNQVEPGWSFGMDGLSCAKPAVNQRIEFQSVLEGEVTVRYEGRTGGDLGLSFVDAKEPATIFDRIVVGGQDGQKAGILSPGKGGGKMVAWSVADGEVHAVVVERSKENLTLRIDGKEVVSVPNSETHNPLKYKLRLHLFEKPGIFNKVSIEGGVGAKP